MLPPAMQFGRIWSEPYLGDFSVELYIPSLIILISCEYVFVDNVRSCLLADKEGQGNGEDQCHVIVKNAIVACMGASSTCTSTHTFLAVPERYNTLA